jgi:hypothetical protein
MSERTPGNAAEQAWPALPLEEWAQTYHTLHMWLQIVGKIRLQLTPKQNHWWNSTLYVNSRGLMTSLIPYRDDGFEIQLDFLDHRLNILACDGMANTFKLAPKSVRAFYQELMSVLGALGIWVRIDTKPQEVADPIPFEEDDAHASYDPEYVNRFWRILVSTKRVLDQFQSRFIGKASPVHFFWGSCDMAYTRFSGRRAPPRKGVISSEGYSHECSSVGWWPGGGAVKGPAFYAYAAPEPNGFGQQHVSPNAAFYHPQLREFILTYDDVRRSSSPSTDLLTFFQGAYEAAANLSGWDRASLER